MGKIVEAVGVASSSSSSRIALSAAIELAMLEAADRCRREDITNPDEVRLAMLAARERVKARSAEADA